MREDRATPDEVERPILKWQVRLHRCFGKAKWRAEMVGAPLDVRGVDVYPPEFEIASAWERPQHSTGSAPKVKDPAQIVGISACGTKQPQHRVNVVASAVQVFSRRSAVSFPETLRGTGSPSRSMTAMLSTRR